MERLLQYALTGLSAGSLYALVALGIVLIYRSTRVLNFAHGDIATLATFVSFSLLTQHYPFVLALGASLLVGAGIGIGFYFGVLVPAQRQGANLLGMVIVSQLAIATIAAGVVGSALLYLLVQRTRLGLAMRATSENVMAAQTLGIPTRVVLG